MNHTIVSRIRLGAVAALVAALAAVGGAPSAFAAASTPVVTGATSYVSGQLATFSVAVPKLANTPDASGKVTLIVDGKSSDTKTLASGKAKFSPLTFTVGSHQVKVSYAGDKKYSASTSSALNITVTKGSTTIYIAADRTVKSGKAALIGAAIARNAPSVGSSLSGPITFTATPTTGAPVVFTTSNVFGLAAWAPKLPDGTYTVKASWPGNSQFTGATSTSITVKVGNAVTPPPVDTDGDRLSDAVEAGLGTNPNNPDTDGDNVKDGDEVLGTTTGVNLPAMGFSALHKDIAVEFDWYDDDTECGAAHSHRPTPGMISRLTADYAAAPLTNPDGTTGIHFIPDYGQGGAFTGGSLVTGRADGTMDFDFDAPGAGFGAGTPYAANKAANFNSNRNGIFYYALMGHRFTGPASYALGVGQLNGDDFVFFADCSNANDDLLANATFHELGHDLGLGHGGFDFENFKPNYNSSMNYLTGDGLDNNCDGVSDGDGSVGFSSGTRPDLDENALDEAVGMCGTPIDWNQNGVIDAGLIAFDLNPSEGNGLTVLKDYNDWANISFAGLNDAD